MNNSQSIVLAATHERYDVIEQMLGEFGLSVLRLKRKEELTLELLDEMKPDWVFFPHWSWNISSEVFEKFRCVIFHMTDLPYGRGGSPLQNLIVNGHQQTKITALQCVSEIDGGPIYLKRPLSLLGTAEEILTCAAKLIAEMIMEIVSTSIEPIPQAGEPTYFKRRTPADGDVRVLSDLGQLYDFIRMLDGEGYPPAFLETEHFRLEFSRASLRPDCVQAEVKITRKNA